MGGNTQRMTILAQDPAVLLDGTLMLVQVDVPSESLAAGPTGYRVKVVDFDSTADRLYMPRNVAFDTAGQYVDPYALPAEPLTKTQRKEHDRKLLADPGFHAQNVYAIVMRTLARFEFALGRRACWGFKGHQLHVAPHAFCDANAFYSETDCGLLFGYFRGARKRMVFTCLSHDIVVHETTHALLDGLRDRYTEPSGPDQAGFHEGFSDVTALLSVFSMRPVVELALTGGRIPVVNERGVRLVSGNQLSSEALAESILFGLAKEFGRELDGLRANALRRSLDLKPSKKYVSSTAYDEPHARGEIFSAALLYSMLELWVARIEELGTFGYGRYNLDMVIDEGVKVAEHLLTMVIRALDYCPSVDLEFADFLAALLTVDREVTPDDSRFQYRDVIRQTFAAYDIEPPTQWTDAQGCWKTFQDSGDIVYSRTNFESMLRDKEEVFRFIWENRDTLEIDPRGYTEVTSVRPSTRHGPDGFMLRETICEYVEIASMYAAEMKAILGVERPAGMPPTQSVRAYGGGALVFDQYGRIKYHIKRRMNDAKRQFQRIEYLWTSGALEQAIDRRNRFAVAHLERADV